MYCMSMTPWPCRPRAVGDGRRQDVLRARSLPRRLHPREVQGLWPGPVVFERKDELDGLGAAGAGLAEGFQGLADLAEPRVGVLVMMARGTVDAIEDGRDLEDLAPGLEEIPV